MFAIPEGKKKTVLLIGACALGLVAVLAVIVLLLALTGKNKAVTAVTPSAILSSTAPPPPDGTSAPDTTSPAATSLASSPGHSSAASLPSAGESSQKPPVDTLSASSSAPGTTAPVVPTVPFPVAPEPAFRTVTGPVGIIDSQVKILGRSRAGATGGIELFYSGSGFTFQFEGTAAYATLSAPSMGEAYQPYVRVLVDGKETADFTVSDKKEYVLAEGLSNGRHTVEVIKRTECFCAVTAYTLRLSDGARLSDRLADSVRKIEFIGDSITCGYGNIAPSGETAFKTQYEDQTSTFSYLLGKRFGADIRLVAQSGNGISRNNGGGTANLIPALYPRVAGAGSAAYDFSSWQADVVCINLGTNDEASGKATKEDFIAKSVSFLKTVRQAYPDAVILWSYGTMINGYSTHIRQAIEDYSRETGDMRVSYLQLDAILSSDGYGTHGHPNAVTNRKTADVMAARIQELTGWEQRS